MASFEQNKANKKWSVRFRVYDGDTEIHKRLSGFATKREAREAYEKWQEEHKRLEPAPPPAPKFKWFAEQYLIFERGRVKASSYYTMESKIKKQIAPYFNDRGMDKITPLDIIEWQNTLSEYSYKYVSGLRTILSSIFKYAEKYHDVPNIMRKVDGLRNTEAPKEMKFWTPEQFTAFISCVDVKKYELLFRTLYITGARKGEILALSPGDIDHEKGTIRINKNITRKIRGLSFAITSPKNASSVRTIPVPEALLKDLKDFAPDGEFIFGGDAPLSENAVTHAFNKYIERAGVPKIRIHDLRHSCASLLISQGVSIVAVSKRLGHQNIEQTLNTYSHLMPSDNSQMLEIFKNF